MGSKSSGGSKPSSQSLTAADALNAYVLGPAGDPNNVFFNQPAPTSQSLAQSPGSSPSGGAINQDRLFLASGGQAGAPLSSPTTELAGPASLQSPLGAPSAGNLPGTILPNFDDLLDLSSTNVFDQITQGISTGDGGGLIFDDTVNPVLQQALGGIFDPSATFSNALSTVRSASGINGSNFSIDAPDFATIVDPAISQQAVSDLANLGSVFDQNQGGLLDQRLSDAQANLFGQLEEQSARDLDRNLQIGANQSAASNAPDSAQIRQQIDTQVQSLNDLGTIKAGTILDNEKFLQNLALQDLQLEGNRLTSLIELGLTEQGMQRDTAAQFAAIEADIRKAMMTAEINAAGNITTAQIGASTNIFGQALGAGTDALNRELGVSTLPLDILGQVATGLPGTSSQSSKSI